MKAWMRIMAMVLALLSAGLWLEPAVPAASAEAAPYWMEPFSADGFECAILEDGTLMITQCLTSFGSVSVPETINGLTVTTLGKDAFQGCALVDVIAIPSGVTRIDGNPFADCMSLTRIDVAPDNAAFTFAEGALFDASMEQLICYCGGLQEKQYHVPEGVRRIGDFAFSGNDALESLTIPASVEDMGINPIMRCLNLRDIRVALGNPALLAEAGMLCNVRDGRVIGCIPASGCTELTIHGDGIVEIGPYAFFACPGLKSVRVPEGVTSIGICAFSGCDHLTELDLAEGVAHIGAHAFEGCAGLQRVVLPRGLRTIGEGAFSLCFRLEALELPESLEAIGDGAFHACERLRHLRIPDGVTYIGSDAFGDCKSLNEIDISADHPSLRLEDGALICLTDRRLVYFPKGQNPKEYVVPEDVEIIGAGVFSLCDSLERVVFPEGLRRVEDMAFYGCSALYSAPLPASLEEIGEEAFSDTALGSARLPEGLRHIGSRAFSHCTALTEISVPGGVARLGDGAFMGCTALKSARLGEGVAILGPEAFSGCENLTALTLPGTLQAIGTMAFYNCWQLRQVAAPEGLARIDPEAFGECDNLILMVARQSAAEAYCRDNDVRYAYDE